MDTHYAKLLRLRGNKSTDSLFLLSQGSAQVVDFDTRGQYFSQSVESGDHLVTLIPQIHNTFGERHVHILEVGKNEEPPDAKYDFRYLALLLFFMAPIDLTTNGPSRGLSTFPHSTTALVPTLSPFGHHFLIATLG